MQFITFFSSSPSLFAEVHVFIKAHVAGPAVSQPRVRLEPVLAPYFVQTIYFLVLQFTFLHSSMTILPRLSQYSLLCHWP